MNKIPAMSLNFIVIAKRAKKSVLMGRHKFPIFNVYMLLVLYWYKWLCNPDAYFRRTRATFHNIEDKCEGNICRVETSEGLWMTNKLTVVIGVKWPWMKEKNPDGIPSCITWTSEVSASSRKFDGKRTSYFKRISWHQTMYWLIKDMKIKTTVILDNFYSNQYNSYT